MASQNRRIKVLLARFPLETHSRGAITVAGMLRDAGMEVILLGNAQPQKIVEMAKKEGVDVVGLSSYCGGELALCGELMKAAERQGIKASTIFILGGVFPPGNASRLKELGFSAVFPPSSTKEEIVDTIKSTVADKK